MICLNGGVGETESVCAGQSPVFPSIFANLSILAAIQTREGGSCAEGKMKLAVPSVQAYGCVRRRVKIRTGTPSVCVVCLMEFKVF